MVDFVEGNQSARSQRRLEFCLVTLRERGALQRSGWWCAALCDDFSLRIFFDVCVGGNNDEAMQMSRCDDDSVTGVFMKLR